MYKGLTNVLLHHSGTDVRRGHFLVKMNVKMKELGPVGGGGLALPPLSAMNAWMYPHAFIPKTIKATQNSSWLMEWNDWNETKRNPNDVIEG